ncbi:PREDICTED: uncharacterized protein LOC107881559 [Prunus mume]|uniref:Uncharacterized protein LOC107881559 n=1 Tax=Prunus mume TaxID=102107 RepID=A0ABM1LUI0_PRUMU|nr:PREDICTED: uncharacterized protein LOC107881559 [Prunus mume]
MERDRVAGSCNSPPYFDGDNYDAWREKFEIFLDALDEYASGYLTKEWVAPVKTVVREVVPKPRSEWTEAEVFASYSNKNARNAIVTALSSTIQHIPNAKQAWDKLRVVHEGDDQVRTLKLQMVLAQFEELRMSETESISEFYGRVEMITNEAMSLDQPIEELLVVQKILRVLPSRFRAKKTAIMEVQNLNEIKLGKLVGKLKTYEMELNMEENDTKKSQNVALQGVHVSSLKCGEKSSGFEDEMALFVKKFRRILKDKGKFAREGSSGSEKQFRPSTDQSNERNKDVKPFTKDFRKSVKCGLTGHIRPVCHMYSKDMTRKLSSKSKRNPRSLQDQVDHLLNEVTKIAKLVSLKMSSPIVPKSTWIARGHTKSLVVLNAFAASNTNSWYFDSGCSKHISGDKNVFSSLSLFDGGTVTFGGGHRSQVVGKGTVCIPSLPELKNVRFVEGLTSNLINVSQLCDDGIVEVRFSKHGCKIIGKGGNEIMSVARSRDNCYCIDGVNDAKEVVCNKVVNETSVLWHQWLRHVNFRDLVEDKILSLKFVPFEKQLADILTKALDFQKHVTLRQSIGFCSID